jgi:hypothetical protein
VAQAGQQPGEALADIAHVHDRIVGCFELVSQGVDRLLQLAVLGAQASHTVA